MRLFDKRTPLQKEWEKLEVQEQRFLQKRSEKRESILNQKLEEKIPPKLQKTLDITVNNTTGQPTNGLLQLVINEKGGKLTEALVW